MKRFPIHLRPLPSSCLVTKTHALRTSALGCYPKSVPSQFERLCTKYLIIDPASKSALCSKLSKSRETKVKAIWAFSKVLHTGLVDCFHYLSYSFSCFLHILCFLLCHALSCVLFACFHCPSLRAVLLSHVGFSVLCLLMPTGYFLSCFLLYVLFVILFCHLSYVLLFLASFIWPCIPVLFPLSCPFPLSSFTLSSFIAFSSSLLSFYPQSQVLLPTIK